MKYAFVLFIFLISCELNLENIYHQLPKMYKTLLNDNDTLIYYSKDNIDTLIIRKLTNCTYQEALSGTSCKEPYEYWEFECIYLTKKTINTKETCLDYYFENHISKYGECEASLPECNKSIQIQIGIGGKYLPIVKFNEVYYTLFDTLESIIVDETEYYNVYLYKANEDNTIFSELYIDNQLGLLEYVSESEIYELKNN